jgi:hypothetical protein
MPLFKHLMHGLLPSQRSFASAQGMQALETLELADF